MSKKEEWIVFTMDGTKHAKHEETGCCEGFGKKCLCGGYMHYQPIYGGYYFKCELCLKEGI